MEQVVINLDGGKMLSKIIIWFLVAVFVACVAAVFMGGFATVVGLIGLTTLAWIVYPEFV